MIRLFHQDLIDGDAIAIGFSPSNAQAELRGLMIYRRAAVSSSLLLDSANHSNQKSNKFQIDSKSMDQDCFLPNTFLSY